MSNLRTRAKTAISANKNKHEEVITVEWIKTSGIYDAKVLSVIETESKNGAIKATIEFVTKDGKKGTGEFWTVNKDGEDIQMGKSKFESLLVVTNVAKASGSLIKVDGYVNDKKVKVDALEYRAFKNKEIKIAVRRVYSTYNGKVNINNEASRFFNTDGLTSTNIIKGVKAEESKELEKEAKLLKDTYRDGLDEDIVTAYFNARAKDKNVTIDMFMDCDYSGADREDDDDDDDSWETKDTDTTAKDIGDGEEKIGVEENEVEEVEEKEEKVEKAKKVKKVKKVEEKVEEEDEDDEDDAWN